MPRFYGLDSHSPSPHDANEPMLARKREREDANPSRTLVAQEWMMSKRSLSRSRPKPEVRLEPSRLRADRHSSSVRETAPDRRKPFPYAMAFGCASEGDAQPPSSACRAPLQRLNTDRSLLYEYLRHMRLQR